MKPTAPTGWGIAKQMGVDRQFQNSAALFGALFASTVAAGWTFHTWTSFDLDVSRAFRTADDFVGNQPLVELLRDGFRALYGGAIALAIWGLLVALRNKWLGVSRREWMVVLICLIVGPGLVANITFKQNWGRPRPHQTLEFGGTKMFVPAGQPSTECKRHCSFVSGEAAAAFSVFYSLAVVVSRYRLTLVTIGTLAGLIAGTVRISQGGHFLSDVIFAGLLMAGVSVALHWVFCAIQPSRKDAGLQTQPRDRHLGVVDSS